MSVHTPTTEVASGSVPFPLIQVIAAGTERTTVDPVPQREKVPARRGPGVAAARHDLGKQGGTAPSQPNVPPKTRYCWQFWKMNVAVA